MIVCHCTATTDCTILEHVAQGCVDPDALASACGAGRDCGGCLPLVERLLDEFGLGDPVAA